MKVCTCQAGPLTDPEVDWSDVLDEYPDLPDLCANDDSIDDDDSVEEPIEDGNHISGCNCSPRRGVHSSFIYHIAALSRGLP